MTPSTKIIPPTNRLHHALQIAGTGVSALRHRNFRIFFFGQLISLTGTWMQSLGQQWLVFTLSHSALQLGIVSAFQFLPVLLFSLFAGVIVERMPKRRLIVITQILFLILSAILGLLVVSGHVQIWHVYIIAALYGTVNAFDVPARQAFMVDMVGREDLTNGIALNSSIFNASRIFGPAIAALLINSVGIAACFLLNAASFVPVIIGLLLMHVGVFHTPAQVAKRQPLRQIAEGLAYIRRTERVALIFGIVTANNIFGISFYVTLLPIFATTVLHAHVDVLGEMGVALGIGATVGAFVLAYLPTGPARGNLLLGGAVCMGLLLIAFGLSRSINLSLLLLVGVGFCVVSINSSGNALIQETTPDHLRGRVMSVWGLVLLGLTPIGSLIAGSLAQRIGAPLSVITGAVVCISYAIYANIRAQHNHIMTLSDEPSYEPVLD